MKQITDQDGESKMASDADADHYPEQHLVVSSEPIHKLPTHEQIADRAYLIWMSKGHPAGSQTEDWLQAEGELHALLAPGANDGSVQA